MPEKRLARLDLRRIQPPGLALVMGGELLESVRRAGSVWTDDGLDKYRVNG